MQRSEPIQTDPYESVPYESAERYRAFFEASNDALFVEDITGRILDVNARACELLGYTGEELKRMSVADLLPADAPQYLAGKEAFPTQTRLRLETLNRHKDGRLIPVEVVGQRISLGGRELWLISARDTSDRKRLERALAERSAQLARLNRLSKVLSKSLDGAWIAQTAVNRIRAIADLDVAAVAVVGDALDAPTPIYYSSGVSDAFKARFVAHTRTADRLIRQVAILGFPLIIDEVRSDTNLPSRIQRLIVAEGVRTVVILPIVVGGQVRGVLVAAYRRVTEVDEAVLHLLEAAVRHLGHALANAWLFRREQQRAATQQALVEILGLAIQSMRADDLLPALAEHAGRLLDADGAFITRWDDAARMTVHAAADSRYRDFYPALPPTPADQPTLTRAVLEAGRPIAVYDVYNSPYTRPDFAGKFAARSLLGLPLFARGRRLGALLIASDTPRRFAPAEIELAQSAANLIALAIDNSELFESVERQRRQADTLREVTASLTSSLDLDAVLNDMLDQLRRVVVYDSASIQLLRGDALEIVAGRGFPDMDVARRAARDIGIRLRAQDMLATRRALVIPDTQAEPAWIHYPGQEYIRSWIGAPLFERDRLIGVLNVDHRQPNAYDEETAALVTSFAHQAAIAISNARLYQEARQRARSLSEEVALRTQELRNANEQLRSLDRLKSQLIEQIGHQFRTPVANIGTHLRLLESGRPEKRDHYMAVLNDQTEALKRLIEKATAFAEVDLAPDARPYELWPIANVVDPLAARYRPDAAAKSIRFEVAPGGAELRVRANPQRIGTALNEILSNAFDYTDEGGRVTLSVEQVDEGGRGWVRISVIDTGVGIPADELPRVFDQFFRGRQRLLQVRGVGIGLSLVQAIVQTEGGRVTAESAGVGQGSTFRLWLPEVR